ncbi:MAG TPA: ABC transporter substrate-binding protein [Solirubrobacteraceae bacterium]|nr:ABC transporter substrate-binding protein [Solirubrobacteraceae bacterium]
MTRIAGIVAAVVVATALALAGSGGSASGQDGKPRVFTVGYTQDVDSFNPTVGVTVAAYEAWNIQYATLTDKAAKDFSVAPGLAESWKGSADGKTWTYKLHPNMKWSDGQPLTSEDVVYTINRSRDDGWFNHTAIVANLKAEAPDPNTVVITSSVPDPKLPVMDAYIVPKHIFEKYDEKALTKYDALDGVGSGPYTLEEFKKGQFARFKANPNFWRGKPPLDVVVIRNFNNADAMVAALRSGEIDAANDVPGAAFDRLEGDDGIEVVEGNQGSFNEFALNGGDGLEKGHPALSDPLVRQAIAHAIDKQTIVDRVESGHATPADTISPSANPEWMPEVPADKKFDFDLDKANALLDQGGYEDTDGDGVREMPGGGEPLRLRYAVRSESPSSQPTAEFITGWLKDIGIATTQKVYDDGQLTEVIGKGDYDLFVWGWTPFVDPDTMLSYFTCDQVSQDPEDPTNYYNDASLCDKEYDKLYAQQKVELDHDKRVQIVHEMLTRWASTGVYDALYTYPDLQAYRTDRFTGFVRQPEGTGPVLFSNSSPSYARLEPVSATSPGGAGGDDGGGGGSAGIIALVVLAALAVAGGTWAVMRRRTADERE